MNNVKAWILVFVFAINIFFAIGAPLSDREFSGRVTEKWSGKPINGVSVYLPDFRMGTFTDEAGRFTLKRVPASKTVVFVGLVGYRNLIETIDLSVVKEKNFEMEYTATELNEVVVTGLSKPAEQKRTPAPIVVISNEELREKASSNIIDALSALPGVSQVTTGAAISKPVIRGLGYNRVVVINDGVRQEGQQWGDEHGIEIDGNAVHRVEILKGPASLVYGSDAMAGVVNLISSPNLPEGKIAANLSSEYQSNNGLRAFSFDLSGNKKGIVWDARYSKKQAHAYKNRYDGYVYNSGFRENAFSGMVGLNKSWGFSNLKLSLYHLNPGIVEGERDSLTGKFVKPVISDNGEVAEALVNNSDNLSYKPHIPFQQIYHYKAVWENKLSLPNQSTLGVNIGFQQNQRKEFADFEHPKDYELFFLLNTLSYDIRYNAPGDKFLNFSLGVNGMSQSSENRGVEFLIPEYNLFDAGLFSIVKKRVGPVDISGGLRFDSRSQNACELYLDAEGAKVSSATEGAVRRFPAFDTRFSGWSGSLGATWQISRSFYTKLNLSRGFRAPNVSELGANGVHEGTIRYETGDPNLKPESSLQFDYTLGYNTEHISAEINLFANKIQNYIYLRKLSNMVGTDSIVDNYSVFRYVSGDAVLRGGEFRFDIHPHPYDWLHFENSFSYVEGIQTSQPDSTRNLPLIPAPKWIVSLKAESQRMGKYLRNAYLKIESENYFLQNRFYSAFGTESRTPGYSLLNLGFGSELAYRGRELFSIFVSANNLLDVAYQNHLSRLKYAAVNNVTGRQGVYNMGRNISLKIVIPIHISK